MFIKLSVISTASLKVKIFKVIFFSQNSESRNKSYCPLKFLSIDEVPSNEFIYKIEGFI